MFLLKLLDVTLDTIGWSMYHKRNKQQENPLKKLSKREAHLIMLLSYISYTENTSEYNFKQLRKNLLKKLKNHYRVTREVRSSIRYIKRYKIYFKNLNLLRSNLSIDHTNASLIADEMEKHLMKLEYDQTTKSAFLTELKKTIRR